MALLKLALLPLLLFTPLIHYRLTRRIVPAHAGGTVAKGFEGVKQAFEQNFADGWEREGAAVAVYHDGKKIVDLWGGYSDGDSDRLWKEDTISIIFSTTKALGAISIALLVDRGKLRYEDTVAKHWPGFAKNGKDKVTVQQLLSHQGGLAYFDFEITKELAASPERMRALIENERLKWKVGEAVGYHAYTVGWLVDQLIRAVDGRGIAQFFREELAQKHDLDLHIGLPAQEFHRVARVTVPSVGERMDEMVHDYRVTRYLRNLKDLAFEDSTLSKVVKNPRWLEAVDRCTLNTPEVLALEQSAALGTGSARSLANLLDLAFNSDSVLSAELRQRFRTPLVFDEDFIFHELNPKGYGFIYYPLNVSAPDTYAYGHSGHGCQQTQYDPINKVTIAYITNGLKTGLAKYCRSYSRLETAVYDALRKSRK